MRLMTLLIAHIFSALLVFKIKTNSNQSIGRGFMAAPLQTAISAGAWSPCQALSIRVPEPEADTSTHLASASASHRAAKLAPSVGAS